VTTFEDLIAAQERVEPRDAMPDAYRATLVRQIASTRTARSSGCSPSGNWLTRAPSLRRKAILLAKVQDEAATASTCTPPRRRRSPAVQLLDALHAGRQKYSSIFNWTDALVADIAAIGCWSTVPRSSPGAAVPVLVASLRPGHGADLQGGVLPPAPGLDCCTR